MKDDNGHSVNTSDCGYCYKFRFLWGLEDGTLIPPAPSGLPFEWGDSFEYIVKDFLVELRKKMFHEQAEDLLFVSNERLIRKEPLTDGEKVSVLIENEEKQELKRLLKKYGQ